MSAVCETCGHRDLVHTYLSAGRSNSGRCLRADCDCPGRCPSPPFFDATEPTTAANDKEQA